MRMRIRIALALLLLSAPAFAQGICPNNPPLRIELGPYRVRGHELTSEQFDAWLANVRALCEAPSGGSGDTWKTINPSTGSNLVAAGESELHIDGTSGITVTSSGGNTLTIASTVVDTDTDDQTAAEVPYTPATASDWTDPDPADVAAALDALAAKPSASGDVTGPASSTAHGFALFADTTGKLLESSAWTLDGSTLTAGEDATITSANGGMSIFGGIGGAGLYMTEGSDDATVYAPGSVVLQSGTDQLRVEGGYVNFDNFYFEDNEISTQSGNLSIILAPNGTGEVTVEDANIGMDPGFTVDGVDVSAHASRHAQGGADPLSGTLAVDVTGSAGDLNCTDCVGATEIAPLAPADAGLGNVTNDAQTKSAIVPNTTPSAGQLPVGNAGGTAYAPKTLSGDATLDSAGVLTITKADDDQPDSDSEVPNGITVDQGAGGQVKGGGSVSKCARFDASHNLVEASGDCASGDTTISTPVSVASGGTGTGSTLTGLVRGSASAMTAAEISGDCTTSGSNAITCTKTGGVSFAASATTDATNASNLASGTVSPARLGTGSGGSTKFLREDSTWQTVSAAVPGSTTQVIFNDAGAEAGDAGLTYNKTTDVLTMAGSPTSPGSGSNSERYGAGATTGSAPDAIAIGAGASCTGSGTGRDICIGKGATDNGGTGFNNFIAGWGASTPASTSQATCIGTVASCAGSDVGIGSGVTVGGTSAVAIGLNASSTVANSVVIGVAAASTGQGSVLLGYGAVDGGTAGSFVVGSSTVPITGQQTVVGANGMQRSCAYKSEQLTLSTSGTTTDTTANLILANGEMGAITYRITTAIATATAFTVKIKGGNSYCSIGTATTAQTTLTANTTGVLVPCALADTYTAAASKLTVDTTGTPSAGVLRLTTFSCSYTAPTS